MLSDVNENLDSAGWLEATFFKLKKKMFMHFRKRAANYDWLINFLWVIDPENNIFGKGYVLPIKEGRQEKV